MLIREFSETLIAELALRDELEYEKELKNTFISLLLAVQNKRRAYHIEKKKRPGPLRSPNLNSSSSEPKVGRKCSVFKQVALVLYSNVPLIFHKFDFKYDVAWYYSLVIHSLSFLRIGHLFMTQCLW